MKWIFQFLYWLQALILKTPLVSGDGLAWQNQTLYGVYVCLRHKLKALKRRNEMYDHVLCVHGLIHTLLRSSSSLQPLREGIAPASGRFSIPRLPPS